MYTRQRTYQILAFVLLCHTANATEPSPLSQLGDYLKLPVQQRGSLAEQRFAQMALTTDQAAEARKLLLDDRTARLRDQRAAEMKAAMIQLGDLRMPFSFKRFGAKPKRGRSLFISLHGGGGAPKRVNDSQWENQKRLYTLDEGIYVAPRAPTDTWNLWHQKHIDSMLTRLIENMVLFEDVNWNRVYVMGYSAGGDGVFQLAPRMADRWAAAAMMAGHPNETSPLGLRNVPFALQVGGRDAAYNRNKVAISWKEQLAKLRGDDPDGYEHFVKIYADKGHWMDREDAAAIPWMAKFDRNPLPSKIVWKQDDVTHTQLYWLGVDNPKARSTVIASRDGQTIQIDSNDVDSVTVLVDDRMIDFDKPIVIRSGDTTAFEGTVERSVACIAETLAQRGDPHLCFAGKVTVDLAAKQP